MMCRINSYNKEKLDFTTTRPLPLPCAQWLVDEDRLLLTTTSYPSRTRWTDMQQLIRYCRSSNIIVRLLKEAKSQEQPERGSYERSRGKLCVGVGRGAEPWSTHIARLLHETKGLFGLLLCLPYAATLFLPHLPNMSCSN